MLLLFYIAIGAVAGLFAGLFGIGGGIIIVPALIYAFQWQGVSDQVLTHMAIATSLATIVVTSVSSVLEHHRNKAVLWPVFIYLGFGIIIGSSIGVATAVKLEGYILQILIGSFAILVAIKMGFELKPKRNYQLPRNPILSLIGVIIGTFSALFGIGGGTMTVPFLAWCNIRMQQAVATAAACGLPIALVGVVWNVIFGWQNENLPEWSSGYVYWPAWFGIVITSFWMAKYGAKLAHRLSERKLKRIFAIFLALIGLNFILNS